MIEPAFSEVHTTRMLDPLDTYQQLAFGAACCERILHNYRTFSTEVGWGETKCLRIALGVVWQGCESERPRKKRVRNLLATCESNVPISEDFDSLYTSSAQDAVFAVCSLLEFFLEMDIRHVVNAARYPTDSIDLIVQERGDLDPQDPELEQKILEHPLMQQELLRQRRDLAATHDLRQGDLEHLGSMRRRAESEEAFVLSE